MNAPQLVNDGTNLFQEQSIAGGAGIAKMTQALAYFTVSAQQRVDANKYGVYIISPNKYKSSNKLTCLKKAGTSRTPCYYYECPSNYMGEKRINLVPNRNNQCLYIKYPLTLKYSN